MLQVNKKIHKTQKGTKTPCIFVCDEETMGLLGHHYEIWSLSDLNVSWQSYNTLWLNIQIVEPNSPLKGSSNTPCGVHSMPKHEFLCMVIVNHPCHLTQHEELLLVPFYAPRIPNFINMNILVGRYVSLCRSFVDIILHHGIIFYVYGMHSPSTPSLVVSS